MYTIKQKYYAILSLVWLTVIAGIAGSIIGDSYLFHELATIKEQEFDLSLWAIWALAPTLCVFIVCLVSLWWRARWAKHGFTMAYFVCILMTPFMGPMIESGFSALLLELAYTVDGAFIALIYFSDLKMNFSIAETPIIINDA